MRATSDLRISRSRRCSRLLPSFSHRQPDEEGEDGDRRRERSGEEPQCSMQNRLAIELHSDRNRGAVEPIGKMLFPGEDVAALCTCRFVGIQVSRVVPEDS